MANFTYSGDPSASDRDQVRFLVGDTNPKDPQLLDAEVDWLVSTEGITHEAAIAACSHIAARYSREVDAVDEGPDTKTGRKREVLAKHYRDLADDLRRRRIKTVGAYAGALSQAEKDLARADTDTPQPTFSRGMQDNLRAGNDESCP